MKVCDNCGEVVLDKVEICPNCSGEEFTELLVAVYDDYGPYLEEEDG